MSQAADEPVGDGVNFFERAEVSGVGFTSSRAQPIPTLRGCQCDSRLTAYQLRPSDPRQTYKRPDKGTD